MHQEWRIKISTEIHTKPNFGASLLNSCRTVRKFVKYCEKINWLQTNGKQKMIFNSRNECPDDVRKHTEQ